MAGKITIPIVRDTDYQFGDRLELEVDGQVQPDLIQMWDSAAERAEAEGGTPDPLMHETLARFPAGDYAVRLRGIDLAGNVGNWSAAQTIRHRPQPERPTGLVISGSELQGSWADA